MKRFLALILASLMLLTLASCGNDDVRGEISGGESQATGTVEASTATETATAEETPSFSMGLSSGSNYENKFIGIGCNLPEGWTFYTDDQIKELNNIAAEAAGDEFEQLLANATIIYDMQATNTETGSTVAVNLEKHNALSVAATDLKELLNAQVPSIKTAFENMGYNNIVTELTTVTIDDTTYDAMSLTAQINGVSLYEVLFAVKCGAYIANVTVATAVTDETQTLLDCFYTVK